MDCRQRTYWRLSSKSVLLIAPKKHFNDCNQNLFRNCDDRASHELQFWNMLSITANNTLVIPIMQISTDCA
jgi:hypothetical protein